MHPLTISKHFCSHHACPGNGDFRLFVALAALALIAYFAPDQLQSKGGRRRKNADVGHPHDARLDRKFKWILVKVCGKGGLAFANTLRDTTEVFTVFAATGM